MGNEMTVTTRTFTVKEGMTPEDVRKSPYATAQQKKMADVFDADGVKGYSKREAEVFNATAIADHGKDGVSLWTKYSDGSRKETAVKGDLKAFKYAPEGNVKSIAYKEGKPTTRNVEKKQPQQTFKYTSPKIGEDGIMKVDTILYAGTKKPEAIYYYSSAKQTPQSLTYMENYSKDGKIKDFTKYYNYNEKSGLFNYSKYNNQGEEIEYSARIVDDRGNETGQMIVHEKKPDGGYRETTYDKTGQVIKYESTNNQPHYSSYEVEYKYNNDGTHSERTKSWSLNHSRNELEVFDKNNRLIRKKDFDTNDVVKYTVIPKYDKDGLVIKNDTIWNKQK